jgi:hypothetical protein
MSDYMYVCMHVCIYVCMYVCVCVCVCIVLPGINDGSECRDSLYHVESMRKHSSFGGAAQKKKKLVNYFLIGAS